MDRALDTRLLRFRNRPEGEDPRALATDLMSAQRGAEAMEVAATGLKADPHDGALLLVLGRVLMSSGDLPRAQAALLEAAKGLPSSAEPFRYLGEVLLARDDAPRAAKVLGRALALSPRDGELRALHDRATRLARGIAPAADAPAPIAPPPAAPPPALGSSPGVAVASPVVASPVVPTPAPLSPVAPAPVVAPSVTAAKAGGARPPAGLWSSPPKPAVPAPSSPGAIPAALAGGAPKPSPQEPAPVRPSQRPSKQTVLGVGAATRTAAPVVAPLVESPRVAPPPAAEVPPPSSTTPPRERPRKGTLLDSSPPPASMRPELKPVVVPEPVVSPPPARPAPEVPAVTDTASRAGLRAPKMTQRGVGDSERPTSARASSFDAAKSTHLLGDVKPYNMPPPPPGPPPADPAYTAERAWGGEAVWDEDMSEAAAPSYTPSSLDKPQYAVPVPAQGSAVAPAPRFVEASVADAIPRHVAEAVTVPPARMDRTEVPEPADEALPVFDGTMPETVPDASMGDAVGVPDGVDRVLEVLEQHGLFEPPASSRASWMSKADMVRPGTSLRRVMVVLWVLGIAAAGGGYAGWKYWIRKQHDEATRLVASARSHAMVGDHKDLVDAERELLLARGKNPRDLEIMRGLLFVQSQRALEDGAFEPGYLRPTLAKAASQKLASAEVPAARAVLEAADGNTQKAQASIEEALKLAPSDASILYLAGRLAQRLGSSDALGNLEKAIASSPHPMAAAVALAEARADDGRRDDAIGLLEDVIKARPDHLRAALWRSYVAAEDVAPDKGLADIAILAKRLDRGAPTDAVIVWLTRVRLYRRKGDVPNATKAVDEAVRAGASEPRLLALVAGEARAVGLWTRAQAAAAEAVSRAPSNPEFRKLLAQILVERRDGVHALGHLATLSMDDPDVLTMSARAALLVGTEKALAAAETALEAYLREHKDAGVEMRALQIRTQAARGQGASVLASARKLVKEFPADATALRAMGEVALATKDAAGALAALGKLLVAAPDDADAYYLLGRAQRLANQPDASEASLRKAVTLLPSHLDARRALGRLLLDSGKYTEADALYEELGRDAGMAAGQTNVLFARLGRTEALLGLGKVSEARAQIDSVLAADKNDPAVLYARALVALAAESPGDAVNAIRVMAEQPDAPADTIALYGEALAEADNTNAGNAQFERALALDPGLPEALLGKAFAAVRAEKPKDAHKYLDLAADALKSRVRPPKSMALLHYLTGRALIMEGRTKVEPARKAFRDAVALPGVPAEAYFFLGESLSAANSPEAFDAYAKYLELDPEGAYKKRAERAMHRK